MNRFFLVSSIQSEFAADFQVKPNLDLISCTPVALGPTDTERDVIEHFANKGLAVIGIESLEMLKKKVQLIETFKLQGD